MRIMLGHVKRILFRIKSVRNSSLIARDLPDGVPASQNRINDRSNFRRFLEENTEKDKYLQLHADVAEAEIDPIEHWLVHGLDEGRRFPGIEVRRGVHKGADWRHFSHGGRPISVRLADFSSVSPKIVEQITAQYRHDTAVLAPGALTLPNLRVVDASDLTMRNGIDVFVALGSIREQPAVVMVIPFLLIGGAEKYAADMVDALCANGAGPALIIVTEQSAEQAAGWETAAIFSPLRHTNIIFWPDFYWGSSSYGPMMLARLLNAIRPRILVVTNSQVGLEAVARFGRGLSKYTRIACCFFSLGVHALGAPYGARYPRRVMPFALAITDNDPMAAQLHYLHGDIPGAQIRIIPARVHLASEHEFAKRLAARRARTRDSGRGFCWAWVSRIEPFKGTALLTALAAARPRDRFHVFGSTQPGATSGMELPNIILHGPLSDVLAADFEDYDGFLFTSLFEGMPNVVIEMSQQAIPMVIADVGGLRQTFNDKAVIFVRHAEHQNETVFAFSEALDRVAAMDEDAIVNMVSAARLQVGARHSQEAHLRNVASALLEESVQCP